MDRLTADAMEPAGEITLLAGVQKFLWEDLKNPQHARDPVAVSALRVAVDALKGGAGNASFVFTKACLVI